MDQTRRAAGYRRVCRPLTDRSPRRSQVLDVVACSQSSFSKRIQSRMVLLSAAHPSPGGVEMVASGRSNMVEAHSCATL